MGAQSSSFSHDLRTPTRSLHTRLDLQPKSSGFTFSQEMKKGVGEDQTLLTRILYTGRMEEVSQDVVYRGQTVKGNPLYLLHTERVQFEVEWGNEWYQSKKGRLVREDIVKAEKEGAIKRKCTPIITSTSPPPHPHHHPTAVNTAATAPPSPSSTSSHVNTSPSSAFPLSSPANPPNFSLALPPAVDVLPRGFSHSAPLSPAPLSLSERQRSHVDAETGLGERPVQTVTTLDKGKPTSSLTTSVPSLSSSSSSPSTSPPSSPPSSSRSLSSSSSSTSSSLSFHRPSLPRSLSITYNGPFHSALQSASSLEEMTELLQQDTSDWVGQFSCSALVLRVEVLSEEVRVEYFRPKFEYLWAQVQDECPIIMALSNVYHDPQCQELYLPRGKA